MNKQIESKFYGKKIDQIEMKSELQDGDKETNCVKSSSENDNEKLRLNIDIEDQYYGNHYPFCFINKRPLFTIGPQCKNNNIFIILSVFCFCIACMIFMCMGLFVSFRNYQTQDKINYFTLITTLCQAFFYSLTALLNPGICCDREILDIEIQMKICKICRVQKTQDRRHCSDCMICIDGMDHHCPWTGKCIGEGNLCPFYLFILSTIIYFISMFSAE